MILFNESAFVPIRAILYLSVFSFTLAISSIRGSLFPLGVGFCSGVRLQ